MQWDQLEGSVLGGDGSLIESHTYCRPASPSKTQWQ